MKRTLFLIALMMIMITSLFAERISLGSEGNSLQVLQSSTQETILQYKIQHFDTQEVQIQGSSWYHITLPNEGFTQDKGLPQLPVFNRSIIIDGRARMKLEIYDIEYTDIKLPIAPSKGVITRNIDPATIPYEFDSIYQGNSFYPEQIAALSEPYILRDFRGITIKTTPFAYRPSTGTLRVYTAYKVRVYGDGNDTLNTMTQSRDSISRDFAPLYENHFVNWQNQRYTPVSDSFGKLLVICHTNYMSTILPYVNWKIQKGIPTELVQWSTIGTTAAQLQTYIKNRYTADPTIAYVQLVGDAPQIPSLSSGGGGSDPSFSLVAGTDNYPDIFIGRFSAETTAQVTAQINKAIVYERDVTTSDTWLSKALGIASAEGGGSQGDNGESDIQHMNNIRTKLLNYGYSSVDQIYDPGASAATVTTNVNAGRGFMNYVGHGSDTSWSTTGFNNTNATNLTNGNKTPFIMDVACVNGNFVSMTCFAEAWLRNANGGAVAMYASSINQSWNSPMLAEDEVTILVTTEAKYTTGGLYYNGSCKMMDTYGNTTGSDGVNMFKTWHIFGDASLTARTKTPIAMAVTHPSNIISGTSSISVSTGVNNTLVAITYNNIIYGRGFTNSSGNATITLTSPPTGVLNYTITASAHNRVTYVGTIAQTVASGPWMEVTAANYDDANNDLPEYNESGYFDVTFKNSGTSAASNVFATLSCSTTGISITDAAHTISSLAAGASTVADNAYAISIANNVADGTLANFTITMTMSGSGPWTYNFSKTISAPELAFGDMTISDPTGNNNGKLDPGETATISIVLNNTGAAASLPGTGTLSCSTTGITIVNGSANFTAISAAGYTTLNFTVTAASSMSLGTLAAFVFNAAAGAYTATATQNVEVGAPMEIIIGSGSSTQSYPIDRYYTYSGHEAIYLANEIGTPGTIKSMAFNKASGTDVNTIEAVTVYMKNTTATSLATGNYSTTGYTQVYSGTWPNTATSGWMEVDLNTQFAYDGSNLSILTIKGNQAWISNYPMWSYTTASANRARQNSNDNSQPTSLTASRNLPNLKLKLFPAVGMLYPPQNLTAEASHASVTLTWQTPFSGTPTGYKIYRNNTALTTVTTLTYRDTAVTDGTTYSYKVSALYGSDESDPTAVVTATPNMYPPTNLVATGSNNVVQLTWTAATGREAEDTLELGTKNRAISSYKIYRNGTAHTTVSGTSYNDTAVTNGTAYSYYVTTLYTNPAGESAASNTATATPNMLTEVVIGTGTSSTGNYDACPISVWYQSLHGQSVYTKAELNALGVVGPININQLGFNVTGLPAQAMPNYVVRMGHTTATNAASWISTGLTQVWSSASYQPATTGWNMYTLSTPFLWNGTDNIVIDTGFGLIGGYDASGSTQYSTVTSGYRFGRSDTVDQTNLFTGTETSTYRPNVKLSLLAIATGPAIAVNPASISETAQTGNSTTATLTISNTGSAALTWSTPSSFAAWGSVTPLSGTIAAGGNTVLTLTLNAAALTPNTYNANLVISSNAQNTPSLTVPVTFTVNAVVVPSDIRFIAEWEPATGVIIAYASGFGLPYNMIADLSNRGQVYVLGTSGSQSTATSQLSSNGVNMSNVSYIVRNGVDTYWTRDYGPWSIFDANGEMSIVDFRYNRNRTYDNAVNAILDDQFGFNYSYMPLVATGGNVMTDGQGKMMSTTLIQTENDGIQNSQVTEYNYTMPQINDLVEQYLGVTDYFMYADPLSNSNIDHIDCHAKLLDVDKVMIARAPSGSANYTALEATAALWQSKTSSYGTPYQIFRVNQSSANEPYANSFIFNNKIYVPQWNSTPSSYDTAAIAAYQAAMPGYTVQGYYNSSWLSDDAVHCRVNTIYDEQMISLRHVPLTSAPANSNITVTVEITHSNPLNPSSTYVAYRHSTTGQWQNVLLTYVNGKTWTAQIPTPALGQTLYYHILATDTTARFAGMPLCGASDPFKILINIPGANTAPTIALPNSFSFEEDGSLVVDFSQYVEDVDNDTLTLSYSGNTDVIVSIDGLSVTFTATPDWHGTENLSFTISDGVLTADDNVNVIVTSVNDAPTITLPDSFSFEEDGSLTVDFSQYVNDVDEDELTLSYSGNTKVTVSIDGLSVTNGAVDDVDKAELTRSYSRNTNVSVSIDGLSVTFGATADWHGTETITFTISDPELSASEEVEVMVTPVNDAPTIALPDSFSFEEDGSLTVDFSSYVDDVDEDELTLSYSGNTNVTVTIDGLSVNFGATADWHGTETITFKVSDPELSASDQVDVMVTPVNDAPTIALPDSFSFEEDGSLIVDFSSYVNDVDEDELTLSYSGNTNVIVSIDGLSVTFTATPDWHGTENLSFTVSDGLLTADDNVNVIVTSVIDPAAILVAPLSLAYGEIEIGSTDIKTFTITNNGEATLTGNITTPTGYSVAEAGRSRSEFGIASETGKAERNSLSYSVATGVTKTYSLSFTPTEAIAYNGDVIVTSNDPENLTTNISITGMGQIGWLANPAISILYVDAATDYVKVQWNLIPNASYYQVWASEDPYGTFSFLGETTNAYWHDMDLGHAMRFYKVIAASESYLITK